VGGELADADRPGCGQRADEVPPELRVDGQPVEGDAPVEQAADNEAFDQALSAHRVAHHLVTYPRAPHSFFDRGFEDVASLAAVAPPLAELLSGEAEARLEFLGATASLTEPYPYLVVDVGGGSTELIVGSDEPEGLCSIDIG